MEAIQQTPKAKQRMKNIIICIDGTACDLSGEGSNVLRIFRSLQDEKDRTKNEGTEQLAYYDSGVGTVNNPGGITDAQRTMDRYLDQACGYSVEYQVCRAYSFLVKYYEPGDKIFLFGFSRGAYSCRALAGLVHSVGLLPPHLEHLVQLAWMHYSQKEFRAAARFKFIFGRKPHVEIHFVGVLDTVSSFGAITNFKTLPHTRNNPSIRHIRHAVAIDEKRACFQAELFSQPKEPKEGDTFEEIWFAGCHSDIGGGVEEKSSGLAKIVLDWMCHEASDKGCHFDQSLLNIFLGKTLIRNYASADILAPIHPSLTGMWRLIEYVPRRFWNGKKGKVTWHLPNRFKSRRIPEAAAIHSTVSEKFQRDETYHPDNIPCSLLNKRKQYKDVSGRPIKRQR